MKRKRVYNERMDKRKHQGIGENMEERVRERKEGRMIEEKLKVIE